MWPYKLPILLACLLASLIHVRSAWAGTPPGGELYLEARRAQMSGDVETAVSGLLTVIHRGGPLRPFAGQALADIAQTLGDDDLLLCALESWFLSERIEPIRVEAARALGDELLRVELPDEAAVPYQVWLDLPEDARDRSRARWALAQAYFQAGRTGAAEDLLWEIVHDDPSSLEARNAVPLLPEPTNIRRRYDVGYVRLKHQLWAEAERILGALVDAPMSEAFEAQVLYAWAETRARSVSYAEGRKAMYQLALAYPDSAYARKAWQSIASYYAREQRYDDAVRAYDEVVDRYPDHDAAVQALWEGAKLLLRSEALAAAERLGRLAAAYPRHLLADEALRLRGLALYQEGRFADAKAAFQEGYTRYPDRRQADDCAYWEGKAALALGDEDGAVLAFQRVVDHWPTHFYAYRAADQLLRLGPDGSDQPALTIATSLQLMGQNGADAAAALPWDDAEGALPAEADEWESLARWLMTHDLPEARNTIVQLRAFAKTPAQQFTVARLAADAGDYETCVWLADSLRKRLGDDAMATALTDLLYPHAWFAVVQAHADAYGVDPYLPLAVMREESHFRDRVDSWAGARGVMQIMPATGAWLGEQIPDAQPYSHDRLYDVGYNIRLGTFYLSHLLKQFNGNIALAVAGYNGGPGNVRRWVDRYGLDDFDLFIESIPYDETNEYVKKVLGAYATYHRLALVNGSPPQNG